jgi:hypothetical protein
MRRPRFTIRDLILAVAIVALAAGWSVEAIRARRAHAEARRLRAMLADVERQRAVLIEAEAAAEEARALEATRRAEGGVGP